MFETPTQLAVTDGVIEALNAFVSSMIDALPSMVAALTFLVFAALVISVVRSVVRRVLARMFPADEELVVDLAALVVSVFLWFGALLVTLDLLGMGEIAASLGTAVGFVALGVSYALSDVVADTVSGVYLLRDPDFERGDRVTTKSITGTVVGIGLRKTRLETEEGDLVVLQNSEVDQQWRRLEAAGTGAE
ncbi:MAG: mechanosensitive ion channel domain-containing protein [Halanaeroarchaeum sp.]